MTERNVQIKFRNSEGGYDDIFPKTKAELVDGLSASLDGKVDKEPGKGLSTEDYTTIEKNKLAGIEAGANNYTHPATHPASMIDESTEKRFVSDSEKTSWNNKLNQSGYKEIRDETCVKGVLALENYGNFGSILFGSQGERLKTTADGLKFEDNLLWHEGNDGSGSGLDADLLDGKHFSDIQALIPTKLSALTKDINFDERYYTETEIDTELAGKVDKVSGKGLSANDFTNVYKNKLDGIEEGANKYIHPANHPASIITQDSNNRFVTDAEKTNWNNKEDKSNKGQPGGYAGLDANAKVPLSQLPDASKSQTYVVSDSTERNAITGMLEGDKAFETLTGDSYIYDGSDWQVLAQADWENVNLDWNNITNAPSSSPSNIDDAVNLRHEHINKSILDKITDTGSETSYDLAQFVTQSDLGDAGYGDMLKSLYDTNNNGKVDVAEEAESVLWDGVIGKPDTFPPSNHGHDANEISESSDKRFVSDEQILTWNTKTKIVISTTEPDDADIWYQEI